MANINAVNIFAGAQTLGTSNPIKKQENQGFLNSAFNGKGPTADAYSDMKIKRESDNDYRSQWLC